MLIRITYHFDANPDLTFEYDADPNPKHWLTLTVQFIKLKNVAFGSVFVLDRDPLIKISPYVIGSRNANPVRQKHMEGMESEAP